MDKLKNIWEKISNNNFLKKSDKFITVILVIGLLVVINFIAAQIFFRVDLTAAGEFSLSPVSKKTAAALPDIVYLRAYFSKNLPAKYLTLEQETKDILDEYASYAKGKIKVEVIDPATLSNPEKTLTAKGIPALQVNVLRNDSFQVVNGYLGISLEYAGKSEVIPVISDTQNLEYQITSNLKKLAGKEMPVVGLVSSNGTTKITASTAGENSISQAYAALVSLYQVKQIDLSKDAIGEEINTLLIVGPTDKFTDEELKKIDAFVMKGKALIILADGVKVEAGLGASPNDLGWDKLLNGYGLNLNKNLIADTLNGRASFSSSQGSYTMTFLVDYPLWPKISPDNLDKQNVMAANLQSIIFPWPSSITVTPTVGETVDRLAKTTAGARAQTDNFILNPQNDASLVGQAGQYDLAVYASGKLTSPYGQGSTDKARIVLVGDSDFIADSFSGSGSDNLLFFQNIVDGLTLDSDLINIRAKSATERPIQTLSPAAKETVRYVNIFGVTIVVLAFGLARYFLRRRSKKVKVSQDKESANANPLTV